MADDDLKRKALDAFRQSLDKDTAGSADENASPRSASEKSAASAPRRTSVAGAGATRRQAAAIAARRLQQRTGKTTHTPSDTGAVALSPDQTGAARVSAATRSPSRAKSGNVLLWVLLLLNIILTTLCIILLVTASSLRKAIETQKQYLEKQAKALQAIGEAAGKAEVGSQIKFGVYRNAKGELRGVFINYKRPERIQDVELK